MTSLASEGVIMNRPLPPQATDFTLQLMTGSRKTEEFQMGSKARICGFYSLSAMYLDTNRQDMASNQLRLRRLWKLLFAN